VKGRGIDEYIELYVELTKKLEKLRDYNHSLMRDAYKFYKFKKRIERVSYIMWLINYKRIMCELMCDKLQISFY
jgi:hypothetical protein